MSFVTPNLLTTPPPEDCVRCVQCWRDERRELTVPLRLPGTGTLFFCSETCAAKYKAFWEWCGE